MCRECLRCRGRAYLNRLLADCCPPCVQANPNPKPENTHLDIRNVWFELGGLPLWPLGKQSGEALCRIPGQSADGEGLDDLGRTLAWGGEGGGHKQ